MTNQDKRYTVKELLGCKEAMDELLHERILAVRDDLNFAINSTVDDGLGACSPTLRKAPPATPIVPGITLAVPDGPLDCCAPSRGTHGGTNGLGPWLLVLPSGFRIDAPWPIGLKSIRAA